MYYHLNKSLYKNSCVITICLKKPYKIKKLLLMKIRVESSTLVPRNRKPFLNNGFEMGTTNLDVSVFFLMSEKC